MSDALRTAESSGACPLVTVVVPVYDIEMYVGEAIRSVLEQTYESWELLCIDDGSHDGSLRVCESFAESDPRIRVIIQEHTGLGAARNHGIALARGRYIYFLDGDDMIGPHTLESCVEVAEEHDADMVLFGGRVLIDDGRWHDEGEYVRSKSWPGVWNGPELYVAQRPYYNFFVQACTYMSKRELFEGVDEAFPADVIHEDEYGTFRTMMCAKRVVCLDEQFYCHRFRPGSIMTSRDWASSARGYFRSYAMVWSMPGAEADEDNGVREEATRLCLENLALNTIACYYRSGASLGAFAEAVGARPEDEEALASLLARSELKVPLFYVRRTMERTRWRMGLLKRSVATVWRSAKGRGIGL